jgi:hypothetical protein
MPMPMPGKGEARGKGDRVEQSVPEREDFRNYKGLPPAAKECLTNLSL